jgi:hypothetical protein
VELVVNDGTDNSPADSVTIVATDDGGNNVLDPRELNQAAIENLSPHLGESRRFEKAIREIEKSLDPELWATVSGTGNTVIDPLHLDPKRGKKVFDHERHAVKELMHLLKGITDDRCDGVSSITLEYTGPGTITIEAFLKDTLLGSVTVSTDDPLFQVAATTDTVGKLPPEIRLVIDGAKVARIHTSCSNPIEIGDVQGDFTIDDLDKLPSRDSTRHQVSEEALESAQMAVDDLVNSGRTLARVVLEENHIRSASDRGRIDKGEKELRKAEAELAKGDADRDAGKADHAIHHYRKAWEHGIKAIKEQAKLPDLKKEEKQAEKQARDAEKVAEKDAKDAAKAAKDAEKDGKDAAKDAEKAAKDAGKAAKDAEKDAEKAAKDADKDAEKAAKDAEKDVKDADKDAEKAAKDADKDAEKAAKDAAKDADNAAKDAAKDADNAAKDAAKDVKDAEKDAQKAAKDAAKDVKDADKDAEKAAKDAAKDADNAAKDAAKDADNAAKDAAKDADNAAKDAEKAAKDADKNAEKAVSGA